MGNAVVTESVWVNGRLVSSGGQKCKCGGAAKVVVEVKSPTGQLQEVTVKKDTHDGKYHLVIPGQQNTVRLDCSGGCFNGSVEVHVAGDILGGVSTTSADIHVGGSVHGPVSSMSGDARVNGNVTGDCSSMSGDVVVKGKGHAKTSATRTVTQSFVGPAFRTIMHQSTAARPAPITRPTASIQEVPDNDDVNKRVKDEPNSQKERENAKRKFESVSFNPPPLALKVEDLTGDDDDKTVVEKSVPRPQKKRKLA